MLKIAEMDMFETDSAFKYSSCIHKIEIKKQTLELKSPFLISPKRVLKLFIIFRPTSQKAELLNSIIFFMIVNSKLSYLKTDWEKKLFAHTGSGYVL